MGILLGLLLLGHLTVVTYGHPILEGPESVIGPWKGDVNIPCTYGPLKGYTQVLLKWLVQRGSNSVTIFLRDSSGDHIQQAKYRRRLNVSYEVPGDVSLQLNTLEMDDRGHYICEVTWNTPDGTQVVRDKIIEFRVQKIPVSKPTVTTGSGYGFTVPQGMRISLQCQARGSPPISYIWYKEQTNNLEPIRVANLSTLLFKPAVVANSGSYFCTAKGRVGSEQRSDIVKFVVKVLQSCFKKMRPPYSSWRISSSSSLVNSITYLLLSALTFPYSFFFWIRDMICPPPYCSCCKQYHNKHGHASLFMLITLLLDIYSEMGRLDHMVEPFSVFEGPPYCS
uniref:V-set and immunoglobulin domain-containing protein 4 isoform X4 n=1 Tax=Ictidomys tridecemlineatus TaxID=43179 RepID=UPI001A9E35D9|nr:V-set and immunoglobulin domain-containing protein 4 isoform X4 [Ictidomys tridecemlineatus]